MSDPYSRLSQQVAQFAGLIYFSITNISHKEPNLSVQLKRKNASCSRTDPQPSDVARMYHDPEKELARTNWRTGFYLRKSADIALKLLVLSIIVFILWRQFAGVKIETVLGLLDRVGFAVMLVLIPPIFQLFAETLGLALCIPGIHPLMRISKVLPVRIGCDTLINSLPAGVVAAETLRPVWLRRACRIPIEESIAACLMGKINMAGAEGLFLAVIMILVALGRPGHAPAATFTGQTIISMVFILALVFAVVGYVYSGARLTHIMSLLKRIAWNRWKLFLSGLESSVIKIDSTILHFARQNRRAVFSSFASFVAGWIFLGFESYVILRILGQGVSVGQGLLMEGTASLLRIAFFFIPSAFGAAEAAYASLIASFGAADPASVALAFITIKRSQEIIWIALGYIAIMVQGKRKNADDDSLPGAS